MRQRRTRIGLGVFVLAALVAIQCRAAGQMPTQTEIIRYTPAQSVANPRDGRCWTTSIAIPRPDAWRCMVGNEIFDPCFSLADGKAVECGANPAGGKAGFRLNLTEPLPKPEFTAESAAIAAKSGWLVVLADGTSCNPATGTRAMVAGKMTAYYCESREGDGNTVLLDDLYTSGPLWHAEKAILAPGPGGPSLKKSVRVPVRTVYQ